MVTVLTRNSTAVLMHAADEAVGSIPVIAVLAKMSMCLMEDISW